jgi:hypothetical protein
MESPRWPSPAELVDSSRGLRVGRTLENPRHELFADTGLVTEARDDGVVVVPDANLVSVELGYDLWIRR